MCANRDTMQNVLLSCRVSVLFCFVYQKKKRFTEKRGHRKQKKKKKIEISLGQFFCYFTLSSMSFNFVSRFVYEFIKHAERETQGRRRWSWTQRQKKRNSKRHPQCRMTTTTTTNVYKDDDNDDVNDER